MISSGLKKLATQYGLRVTKSVAYGSLGGYAATFSEQNGYKRVTFTTRLSQAEIPAIRQALDSRNLSKEFRVSGLSLEDRLVDIRFVNGSGTLKKMEAFFAFFLPLLSAAGATDANICVQCGQPLNLSDPWKLINGVAYHLHNGCANQIAIQAAQEEAHLKETKTGSYGTGFIGALLGALVGAIPWAIVMNFGYVLSALGFLIGFCSKKGYELLHGKVGKGKVAIVLLCSIAGAVLGCYGGYALTVAIEVQKEALPYTLTDVPMLLSLLFEDSEFTAAFVKDLLIGGAFAILGLSGIFRQLNDEANAGKTTIQDLN